MKWPVLRDILLFVGGLAGVFHETVLGHTDRPTLLILFAAMMGLPAFLQSEVKPKWKEDDDEYEYDDIRKRRRERDERRKDG